MVEKLGEYSSDATNSNHAEKEVNPLPQVELAPEADTS